jgi:hypothetical protein
MRKDRRQLPPPHLDLHILRFSFPRRRRLQQQEEDGGVTGYLQLDWMDDGTDGWKKLHRPQRPLLYVIIS